MSNVPAFQSRYNSCILFAPAPMRQVCAAFVVSCALLVLPGAAASSLSTDPFAGLRQTPLAEGYYDGTALAIGTANLRVTLNTEASQSAEVCHSGFLDVPGDAHRTPCRAVVARIAVDGRNVLTATATLPENDTYSDWLAVRVAIRRLDEATALPQVVITDTTGGSHCCTETGIATQGPDGSWRIVIPGEINSDAGFAFLDLDRDGTAVLVDGADGFLYQYASYAGSFAPTRIRKLSGSTLQDVTREPRYREFLLHELRRMEQAGVPDMEERNGYLAAWVAQKALVGQFIDAWPAVLASYDLHAREGRAVCEVQEHVYTANSVTGPTCPAAYERLVPFPQALALHLVELGYITPEQSAAVGYDPANLDAGATGSSGPGP